VTALVTIVVPALLSVAGLVLDGGQLLAERRQLRDLANGAARAGAQAVSVDALRGTGRAMIDHAAAEAAASAFLAEAGEDGEVTVEGNVVRVVVRGDVELLLLQLVGVDRREVTGRGEARLARGVSQEDP
jgi:Flp pilus assembly protein TadG